MKSEFHYHENRWLYGGSHCDSRCELLDLSYSYFTHSAPFLASIDWCGGFFLVFYLTSNKRLTAFLKLLKLRIYRQKNLLEKIPKNQQCKIGGETALVYGLESCL